MKTMPRRGDDGRNGRQRLASPHSIDYTRSQEAENKDGGSHRRRSNDDRPRMKDYRRHSRSPAKSSHREHRSYRRRSRSRDYDDTSRTRNDRSRRSPHERRYRDKVDHEDHRDRSSRRRRSLSNSKTRSSHHQMSRSPSPRFAERSKNPLPSQKDAFSKTSRDSMPENSPPLPEKEKPNFSNTGRLAAETNMVKSGDGLTSVILKYHEPPEARKPPAKDPWRLYVFKGEDLLETIQLSERSCWLIGRERLVVDLPVDHPSCSKQHAALQFRFVEKRNEYGDRDGRVRPYLIDLESANGSTVNGEPAPKGRFMELMDKDVLKFGFSTREYVLMLPPSG
ncbi:smad nuclear interacting protein [Histoplasma capsulatum var. duboisii H88]|uniref:Smad nuclear interacting protein n=2 Tax=Ajellomyces capsulatus (strain H88) TaxID=544711 RepID=A0A8A1LGS1_AJEC8|nr:smad nuclear interacting protein [Histoplasma capsulatum var. duboisii H88]